MATNKLRNEGTNKRVSQLLGFPVRSLQIFRNASGSVHSGKVANDTLTSNVSLGIRANMSVTEAGDTSASAVTAQHSVRGLVFDMTTGHIREITDEEFFDTDIYPLVINGSLLYQRVPGGQPAAGTPLVRDQHKVRAIRPGEFLIHTNQDAT